MVKITIPKPHGCGRVYIAGPMTGRPDFNRAAFIDARGVWVAAGWAVEDPIEMDDEFYGGPENASREADYMELMMRDLSRIMGCAAIAVLPGWEDSRGARLEVHFANVAGKQADEADTGRSLWTTTPLGPVPAPLPVQTVLEEAQFLIHGPRQGDYGHPFDDFSRTGRIWGAILGIPDVPPEKVALCMVGVKLSRQVNKPKRDNLTDGCGYLGTIELIEKRREASA